MAFPTHSETKSSGKAWTDDDVQQLRELAAGNTPVGVMSIRLNRTEDAIRSRAHAERIALSPPNRPPYGDMS
ncbi:hypothetical protein [Kribbella sp. VKM Ac-2566]|uniref:hypothetical protein n=1 Tax=Kribbella sp. VKM Ac-2566 TaxID=2512218 RepID=UPI001062F911|nr:hypothetical protein [Kribbella sp. VKM Ac-2566]